MRNVLTGLVLAATLGAIAVSCGGNSETNETSGNAGSGGSAAGTGTTGSGGSANGGASSSGGSTSSGSGGTQVGGGGEGGASGQGEVETLGEPCDEAGALACAGNQQKVTLICDADGTWHANDTCEAGQFCDSTPGPDAGSCAEQIDGCDEADRVVCVGDELRRCGIDTVTSELVEACDQQCLNGECKPGAGDDACPGGEPAVDCSGHCADNPADCDSGVCSTSEPIVIPESALEFDAVVARLPAASDLPSCDCDNNSQRRATFFLAVPDVAQSRLVVSPPWHIFASIEFANVEDPCSEGLPLTDQCASLIGMEALVIVGTDDPAAGATNVTYEEGECP